MRATPFLFLVVFVVGCGTTPPTQAPTSAAAKKADGPAAAILASRSASAELLAKVTDEKSATEIIPDLEKRHEEGRTAFEELEAKLKAGKLTEAERQAISKGLIGLSDLSDDCIAQAVRIVGIRKAYDILLKSEAFAVVDAAVVAKARERAEELQVAAKTHMTRNDGIEPTSVDELVQYLEGDQKSLLDPWGGKYKCGLVEDPGIGRPCLFVWTVHPHTGKKIGAPMSLEGAK